MTQVKSTNKALKLSLVLLAGIVAFGALYWYFGRIKYFKNTARHALVNDFFEEAEWRYREAVKLSPFSFEAKLGLAHALQLQKRFKEAKPLYEALYKKDPKELAVLGGLSVCYLSEDRLDEAEAINQRILEISQKESTAWHDLAEIYRRRGDYKRAEEFAIKSIEFSGEYSPFDTMGLKKTVEIYNEMGRHGEAIKAITYVIKRDPEDKLAYFELAKDNEYFKDASLASETWKEFIQLTEQDYKKNGQFAQERAFAEQRLAEIEKGNFLTPPSPQNRLNWGEIPKSGINTPERGTILK